MAWAMKRRRQQAHKPKHVPKGTSRLSNLVPPLPHSRGHRKGRQGREEPVLPPKGNERCDYALLLLLRHGVVVCCCSSPTLLAGVAGGPVAGRCSTAVGMALECVVCLLACPEVAVVRLVAVAAAVTVAGVVVAADSYKSCVGTSSPSNCSRTSRVHSRFRSRF